MIRLAWRQFQAQAVVSFGALALFALVALLTGPHLVHIYDTTVATSRDTPRLFDGYERVR